MESVSRSRLPSKKSSSSNGYASKAIYDDVFGGPPQFGVPTLSPRAEDYSEIFESFHSSRASSIPVLDLPVVDGADLSFDVRSSKFDYAEVFGGFNTLDFAVSYEELFNQSNGGDDSSDEDWTPAQSDSLSDGSDPFACSEKNQSLSNEDPHHSFIGSEEFNVSYDKLNPKRKEDISNGVIYVNNPKSEAPPLRKIEDENSRSQLHNDFDLSMDIVGAVTEGKRLRKTMSQPSNSNFGMQTYRSDDVSPLVGRAKMGSLQNEAFVSVSNISLRTQPSQVPPPSRPPPPLAVKKGDTDGLGSKLRASKSYAFERMTGESSPPYFDVEIDASSSAAASAAAMKDAVEKAQAKLRSAKELMERKKEVQSRTKLRLESDLKYDREESGMKKIEVLSSSVEGEKQMNLPGKSRERKHGKEHKSSHGSCKSEGSAVWTEGSQFYDVVEKEQIKEETELLENAKSGGSGQQKKGVAEAFGQRQNGRKIIAAREENQRKANVKTVNEADKCEELHHPIEDQLKENQVEAKQKQNGANGNIERNESDRQSKGTFADEAYKRELKEAEERAEKLELKTKVKQQKEAREREETEKKQKEACEREENDKKQKEAHEQSEDIVTMYAVQEDNIEDPKLACEVEQNEKNLKQAVEKKEDESKQRKDCEGEQDEKRLSGACEEDDNEKRVNGACEGDDDENRSKESRTQEENEKRSQEACEIEESEMGGDEFFEEESMGQRSAVAIEQEESSNSKGLRGQKENHEQTGKKENEKKVNPNEEYVHVEGQKWKESDKHERDGEKVETPQDTLSCKEDGRTEKELEVVEGLNNRVEERVNSTVDFHHEKNSNEGGNGIGIGRTHVENPNMSTHKREEREKNIKGVNFSLDKKGSKERLVKNVNETRTPEERDKEERSKREMELEKERLRKIEEEREREREREKDRMAVDRATLEARERATGEARERAERAAVERATAEFRQRAMAEAREKLEKATAEARLRAEQRAAVDRATAEARERAVEKVLAEKAADKFSGPSGSGGLRHSSSSSDLLGSQFQSVGPSSGSRFLHSSVSFGVESESAQRCKARLERHRRTAERAENALAEKNKRDLLAQREQTERNRLAENLDAEVKRWSSGKEGNLRALLSTLQYILGADSGWQPVPLTEVITAVAVKKAYRKATLWVHPDKLQQRGATIHQKYICEKVFDLLKEAWNKFNSEER